MVRASDDLIRAYRLCCPKYGYRKIKAMMAQDGLFASAKRIRAIRL